MQAYEHRQFSPWTFLLLAVAAVLAGTRTFRGAVSFGLIALLVVLAAVAIGFSTFSTRVDANGVSWAFRFGVPRGSIPLADIADVQITKTRFWEGYGIHWTMRHGWLWNVWGSDAVMIRKRSGGAVTLGTDDPQGLYDAMERFRSAA